MADDNNSPTPRESSAAFLAQMRAPLETMQDRLMAMVHAELPSARADECEQVINDALKSFVQAWAKEIEIQHGRLMAGATQLQGAVEIHRDFERTRREREELN